MNAREFQLNSLSDTRAMAQELAAEWKTQKGVVELVGNLGAGKTTFVGSVLSELGFEDGEVSSPTFSIVNEYKSPSMQIAHFDFYRLKSNEEALDIGVEEYFYDFLCFVEWPNQIEGLKYPLIGRLEIELQGERRIARYSPGK